MFCSCFLPKRKKMVIKDQLDQEIDAYMGRSPVTTGCLVIGEGIDKKKNKKIPVSAEMGILSLKNLLEEGWETTGETVVLNNKEYIYYFMGDSTDNIPTIPTYDVRAEYTWKRVPVEQSECLQDEGWMARSYCSQTNRIWLCLKK